MCNTCRRLITYAHSYTHHWRYSWQINWSGIANVNGRWTARRSVLYRSPQLRQASRQHPRPPALYSTRKLRVGACVRPRSRAAKSVNGRWMARSRSESKHSVIPAGQSVTEGRWAPPREPRRGRSVRAPACLQSVGSTALQPSHD